MTDAPTSPFAFERGGIHFPHNPSTGTPWQSQAEVNAFIVAWDAEQAERFAPTPPIPRSSRQRRAVPKKDFIDFFDNAMLVAADGTADVDVQALWIRLRFTGEVHFEHEQTQDGVGHLLGLAIPGLDAAYMTALAELWPRIGEKSLNHVQIHTLAQQIRDAGSPNAAAVALLGDAIRAANQ